MSARLCEGRASNGRIGRRDAIASHELEEVAASKGSRNGDLTVDFPSPSSSSNILSSPGKHNTHMTGGSMGFARPRWANVSLVTDLGDCVTPGTSYDGRLSGLKVEPSHSSQIGDARAWHKCSWHHQMPVLCVPHLTESLGVRKGARLRGRHNTQAHMLTSRLADGQGRRL